MQVGVLLLLVAGLAFLVLGLITGSTPLVVASIGASLLAVYVIVRVRREQQASADRGSAATAGTRKAPENARVGATAAAVTKPLAAAAEKPAPARPVPAGAERATIEPAEATTPVAVETERAEAPTPLAVETTPAEAIPAAPAVVVSSAPADADDHDDPAEREPAAADTDPPLRSRGDEPVWVIDGRPHYHLPGCGFLLGRQSEPVPLRQAFEDGFSPCALCDPDSRLAAGRG